MALAPILTVTIEPTITNICGAITAPMNTETTMSDNRHIAQNAISLLIDFSPLSVK